MTFTSVLTGFAPPASFYEEMESRVKALPGVLHTSYVPSRRGPGVTRAHSSSSTASPFPQRGTFVNIQLDGRCHPITSSHSMFR